MVQRASACAVWTVLLLAAAAQASNSTSADPASPHPRFGEKQPARDVLVLLITVVVGALATASGIGGGAIFVPLFYAVLGFGLKASTALSQAVITGGGIAGVGVNILRSCRPDAASKPLMILELAVMLTPLLLLGVSLGVLANMVFPNYLITILLIILLVFLTWHTSRKAVKLGRAERRQRAARAQQQQQQQQQEGARQAGGGDASPPQGVRGGQQLQGAGGGSAPDRAPPSTENSRRALLSPQPSRESSQRAMLARRSSSSAGGMNAPMEAPEQGEEPRLTAMEEGRSQAVRRRSGEGRPGDKGPGAPTRQPCHTRKALEVEGDGGSGDLGSPGGQSSECGGAAADSPPSSRTASTRRGFSCLRGRTATVALQVVELVVMWCGFVALELLRTRWPGCTSGYWVLLGVQAGLSLGAGALLTLQAHRTQQRDAVRRVVQAAMQPMLASPDGAPPPTWTLFRLARAGLVTLAAGTVAGLLGIGGGMVMGPLLLELGLQPQAAAATSNLLVLFSASSAAASYAADGQLSLSYSLVLGLACCAASVLGVLGIARLIKRSGRASLLVWLLAGVIAVGAGVTAGFGGAQAVRDLTTHTNTAFSSICRA